MEHPGFFQRAAPLALGALAEKLGATLDDKADRALLIGNVRTLADATPGDLSFFENRKYLAQLQATRASACLVAPAFADRVPQGVAAVVVPAPYRAFAQALHVFYPEAHHSKVAVAEAGDPPVHPTARIEEGARIEPGAIVGREAQIGRGSVIAAGAVVGYRVAIGRGCFVGPCASVTHALIGDRVILHAGVRIGQDGFGFAMGARGHLKVPQIGRVIIQDDVEIGANSCVDRGALKDTVIGEGSKIDNLVQIGHNVVMGRHCVIVGQVGISGSTEIGTGAQLAGSSHVTADVPPGARMGGTPAVTLTEFGRQIAILKRLTRRKAGEP
jgi:UDP-3-O-[3-hydroxymyristoyl] glucosamine N-acyltransferase